MQSLTFGRSNCDVLLPVTFCAASRSYWRATADDSNGT
jgi:hypothetical protein